LAAVLRFWNLGSIPPHLTPDEASFGYNAYSILKTGKDIHGDVFPIIFKSFGDDRPGLYFYLTVPFVATMGLTELAVRLPNFIFGVLGVFAIYLLTNKLFKGNKTIAIVSSFLLAINPWHIYFSRGAWEPNVALTLTVLGIYFFYRSLEQNKYLVVSSLFFSLTLITYQGSKMAAVIVFAILVSLYWKKVFALNKRNIILSAIIGFLITLPVTLSFFQGRVGRLGVLSIFSYRRPSEQFNQQLSQGGEITGGLSYYLYHSEILNYIRSILGRWFNHFSPRFLFFEGDWQNLRHSAPNHGMFLVSDVVFLIAGLISIFKKKSKSVIFIFLWLLLSPLPAALTRDQVHAVRSLNLVIPFTIVLSFGLLVVVNWIKKLKNPLLVAANYLLLIGIYTASVIYFLDAYFLHLPIHNAKYWYYGYKQVVEKIMPIQENYEKIIFQQSYDQPFIYFLFHQKYDPARYQRQAKLTESKVGDVGLVESLDNISFEFFSWPVRADEKTLIVGDSVAIPDDFSRDDYKLISEIKYPNGVETAFRILEVK
jgi:4-amino-4-deoxy-L-arabinose transferase-like glycosyltransferase